MRIQKASGILNKALPAFTWIIVILGIVVRLAVYMQNRNLFLDEANLARNIYERPFTGLLLPLSYQQFAPPLFLWIVKFITLLFGYSEYSLKLYPICAGIASLIVMVKIMKELGSYKSMWYPLFLFATAHVFIRYSTEFKQHGCDILIVLSLILMALKTDIFKLSNGRFMIFWGIAGSIAIWLSMPSYFALGGVGIYYFYLAVSSRDTKKISSVILIGAIWLTQFLIYYFYILKPAINSDYINNELHEKFLFLFPKNEGQRMHDWYSIKNLLQIAGGGKRLAWMFNGMLILIAFVTLLRKNAAKALLLIVPVASVILAAALHQYALEDRYTLFVMALLIVIIGCGFDIVISWRIIPLTIICVVIAAENAYDNNSIDMMYRPFKYEQVTEALDFLKQENIKADELHADVCAAGNVVYYTQIYPGRDKWKQLKNADIIFWAANTDSIAAHANTKLALLYARGYQEEFLRQRKAVENHMTLTKKFDGINCSVYIYEKK